MRKWLLIFALVAPAWSQTVTISGTVVDPTGAPYSNGSGSVLLVPGAVNWLNGTNPVPTPVAIAQLDSFGRFSVALTNTSLIQPAASNPQWQFRFCSSTAVAQPPICFTMTPTPFISSQDISVSIKAQAALLPQTGGGTLLPTPPGFPLCFISTGSSYGDWGWSACPAGTGNVTTTPPASPASGSNQNIVQQPGTQFSANNYDGIRYVDLNPGTYNWSQIGAYSLTANTPTTISLTACPLGIWGVDTTSYVALSNGSTTEFDKLTGSGTCVPGSAGTIKFTPQNTFTATVVSSASFGIQEAINDATAQASAGGQRNNYHIVFQPTNPPVTAYYSVFAPVHIGVGIADIDGSGASIDCESTQGACFYIAAGEILLHGFRVATASQIIAAPITATACASNVRTITTSLSVKVGQIVDIQSTDLTQYWGRYVISAVSSGTVSMTTTPGGAAATCVNQSTTTTPGGIAIDKTFVEANGNGLHVSDIYYDLPGFDASGYMLNSLFVIDNDQDFRADRVYGSFDSGSLNSCTANYCPQVFYAPGAAAGDPLGHLSNIDINATGAVNGVKWLAGQGITVDGVSIMQGVPQFAIMAGNMRGSGGGVTTGQYYTEIGGAANPLYTAAGLSGGAAQGESAVNVVGGNYWFKGPGLNGNTPFFVTGSANCYLYYAVILDGSNASLPLPFGQACPSSSTPYTIAWPRYGSQTGSTVTYYILRTVSNGGSTGSENVAPYGTGNWSLTSSAIAQCSGLICTMSDSTSTTLQSYTVLSQPTLTPYLNNWPGSVILGNAGVMYSDSGIPASASSVIVVTSNTVPSVYALRQDYPTPGILVSAPSNTVQTIVLPGSSMGARVYQNGIGSGGYTMSANQKGEEIFQPNPAYADPLNSTHIITLNDSNPTKTLSDPEHRPTSDANDVYIGLDQGQFATNAQAQLSFGAPAAISNYIGNIGDNVNWGERLKAAEKDFQVPLKIFATNNFATGTFVGPAFPWQPPAATIDNFTGSGGLGGNWTNFDGTFTKSGGVASLATNGSDSRALSGYTGTSFGNDQYATAKLIANAGYIGVAVRASATGGHQGYECWQLGGGSGTSQLSKFVSGTGSNIGSPTVGPAIPYGDYLTIEVTGTQISCLDNGVTIITATDSSLASGSPGITGSNAGGGVSNFSAGVLSYSSPATFQLTSFASAGYQCLHVDPSGTILPVTNTDCGSGGGGGGTVTSIATTAPLSGGPITSTGTIACPDCIFQGSGGGQLTVTPPIVLTGVNLSCPSCNTSSGTVSTFSANNLSPLFTVSVSNPTTTPSLSFTLTTVPALSIFGNCSGSGGTPSYCWTVGGAALNIPQLNSSAQIPVGEIPPAIPIGSVGSAGLSGTTPITVASSGAIGCATCTRTIWSGTITVNPGAIASGSSASTSVSASGTLTSDVIKCTPAGVDISTLTGYSPNTAGTLTVYPPVVLSSGTVTQVIGNSTLSSVTPTSFVENCQDVR